jgi:2-keto-4-pentenoate hydratase/2-oxohepta-3-ene-1,7-dioic acid hydratase in catechol pathway
MNYVDHCTEQNIPVPKEPVIFSKFNSAITEPNGPVLLSDETQVTVYSIGTLQSAMLYFGNREC